MLSPFSTSTVASFTSDEAASEEALFFLPILTGYASSSLLLVLFEESEGVRSSLFAHFSHTTHKKQFWSFNHRSCTGRQKTQRHTWSYTMDFNGLAPDDQGLMQKVTRKREIQLEPPSGTRKRPERRLPCYKQNAATAADGVGCCANNPPPAEAVSMDHHCIQSCRREHERESGEVRESRCFGIPYPV